MVRHPGPRVITAPRLVATVRRAGLGHFPSRLRGERLTSQLGIALAVAFAVCFGTGLVSHLIQHPPDWFGWPARPVWLYRATQGLHVATGLATVPLLGAKLWSVYPALFRRPPVPDLVTAVERAGVAVLVAAALFELVTGVFNIALWYAPMPFFFPSAHYWTAWLAAGALLAHIGVKLPVVRRSLRRAARPTVVATIAPGLDRRGLLRAVAAASGLITVATVGQTVAVLTPVSVLAPRRPGTGPQGLPVNRTALAAGVTAAVTSSAYRLVVDGPAGRTALTLEQLAGWPQHTSDLPIACVEGWSGTGRWTGVRLRDLVTLVGGDPRRDRVLVESVQVGGRWRAAEVPRPQVADPLTLIALRLRGEPLHPDHGYPARLIAPNLPGVLQTKWVGRITVRGAS